MRKSLYIASGSMLLLGLFWWVHRLPKKETLAILPSETGVADASRTENQNSPRKSIRTNANRAGAETTGTANDLGTNGTASPEAMDIMSSNAMFDEVLAKAERIASQMNRPIQFYGRVVDENNNPVEGANIALGWAHFGPIPTTYGTNVVSDADGRFSIAGIVGAELSVNVEKQGYYTVRSQNVGMFSYSDNLGGVPFFPDAGNPVVFHLRKKGPGVALITSQHGISPSIQFTAPNNVPVGIDLFNQKAGSEGQVEIQMSHEPKDFKTQESTWYVQMTIPSGGMAECSGEFPFEAPEDGYVSSHTWSFTNGTPGWQSGIEQQFYIRFNNPPIYGRFTLSCSAFYPGAYIQYVFNPDGSRYLEPR